MNTFSCLLSFGLLCLNTSNDSEVTQQHAPLVEQVSSDGQSSSDAPPTTGQGNQVSQSEKSVESRPPWRPDKASTVLRLIQAYYDGTKDLKANFRQLYWNPNFESKTETGGILMLKRPGMMVWDYGGANEPDYYADGKVVWTVEHDTRQVIQTSLSGNTEVMAAMKFLFGGQDLMKEFRVKYASESKTKKYGDREHYVLQLKPKKANKHYKGLVLVVRADTGRVDAFVVYNQDGSSNRFTLSKIKRNLGLKKEQFRYKTPEGYIESKD